MHLRIVIILLSFCLACPYAKGQDLTGEYVSSLGSKLVIKGDSLYLLEPQGHIRFWSNDTLAKCYVKRLSDDLIELNSIHPPYKYFLEGSQVIQEYDSTITDGIRFDFVMPYKRSNELEISVERVHDMGYKAKHGFWHEEYKFDYSDTLKSVTLPHDTRTFCYTIKPKGGAFIHTPAGACYGVQCVLSPDYDLKPNCNHVTIVLPHMTDSYFEQYFVDSEYAWVSKRKITWKGVTYKKRRRK